MNIFRGSLNLYLGGIGLKGRNALRSQLNDYKFFSATNSIRDKDNNNRIYKPDSWSEYEELENKINNLKNIQSRLIRNCFDYKTENDVDVSDDGEGNTIQKERDYYLNKVIHNSKFDSRKFVNEEKSWDSAMFNKKACFILLKKHCEQDFGNHIFISEESIIVSLVRRGFKPKFLFVNDLSLIDDLHSSLLHFPIYDAGPYLNYISFGKPLIAFFNYAELNESAKNVEPKIPITIITDYNVYGRFIPKLFKFAAEIGCEKFIFNRDLPYFSHSKTLSEIDVSILKTEFDSNLENIFENIDSNYKILVLAYGFGVNTKINSDHYRSTNMFHVLCNDDAWDKGKIALIITKNKSVEDSVRDLSANQKNYCKYLTSPYQSHLTINQKASSILFELTREYYLRNSSVKKKTKKTSQKKSK